MCNTINYLSNFFKDLPTSVPLPAIVSSAILTSLSCVSTSLSPSIIFEFLYLHLLRHALQDAVQYLSLRALEFFRFLFCRKSTPKLNTSGLVVFAMLMIYGACTTIFDKPYVFIACWPFRYLNLQYFYVLYFEAHLYKS